MRTWRSALNKVAGTILFFSLKKSAAAALVLCAAFMSTAGAQAPAVDQAPTKALVKPKPLDKPLWANLTPSQKIALAPIADEWDQADGVRKQKWLEIANRFASMKPDEQARVHARMRDLFKMSPEERRMVRENYTRAKKIGPTQKSEEWEKYQQLPEEKKKQLADEASALAKKQVANLPSASQSNVKTVAPIKRTPPVGGCAPGTAINTAVATAGAAPCIPAPATAIPAAPAAPIAPTAPVTSTAPPIAPAPATAPVPAPNAK